MSVNKRKVSFNKKDRVIFNSPKKYTESYIKRILRELGCHNIIIKRRNDHNQDEVIFYNENFVSYGLFQNGQDESDWFGLSVVPFYPFVSSQNIGECHSLTKNNIKKMMRKNNIYKNEKYIDVPLLLKEYKNIKKIIEVSDKVFRGCTVNEVLSQEEIDALLGAISIKQ